MKHLLVAILFFRLGILSSQVVDSVELKQSTAQEFTNLMKSYKQPVLVHLKAEWCLVCKKEIPQLLALQQKYGTDLVIREVDLDANPLIGLYFEIDALPVYLLYFEGDLVWNKVGRLDVAHLQEVMAVLKKKQSKK